MVRVNSARDAREKSSPGAELNIILLTESCLSMGLTRRYAPKVDLGVTGSSLGFGGQKNNSNKKLILK